MDDENIKNMDTPQGKPKKEKYSFDIHYGAMAICSIFFGFFAAAANFSTEAIFGSFCLGALCGEFLKEVPRRTRRNRNLEYMPILHKPHLLK